GHLMSLGTTRPVPSGSHRGSETPSGRLDRRRPSPPATGSTHSWAPFSRVDTKASVRPSGDHRGCRAEPGPVVSCLGDAPSAMSPSQLRVVPRFSLREYSVTV